MKISVAMCTYNGERYLQEQLSSFLVQSKLPDELVVCDDGSTDNTVEMLRAFAVSSPFPVRIECNAVNLGSTRNFIKAMWLCTGDLIALSDQDDVWKGDKVAVLSRIFQDSSVSAVFTDAALMNEHSQPLGRSLWESVGYSEKMQEQVNQGNPLDVLKGRYIVTGATMMLRQEARGLFREIPPTWIHDAWMAWMLAVYGKLVSVPKQLIDYRIHPGNQVGVRTSSLLQRLMQRLMRRDGAGVRLAIDREVSNLGSLLDQIAMQHSQANLVEQQALSFIGGRKRFLESRASALGKSRLSRVTDTFALWREYYDYSNGMRTMLSDLSL